VPLKRALAQHIGGTFCCLLAPFLQLSRGFLAAPAHCISVDADVV
jgi:hypothetical protein